MIDLKKLETWIGKDKKKFFLTTLWFIAILLMAYGYYQQYKIVQDINENPCKYVETIQVMCSNNFQERNFSNIHINNGTENKNKTERGSGALLVNGTAFP